MTDPALELEQVPEPESWLDAETSPLLTWKRGDRYHQHSVPAGYFVCAIKLNDKFGFEAWHRAERIYPWTMKADDAREACQAHATAAWRRRQRIGA